MSAVREPHDITNILNGLRVEPISGALAQTAGEAAAAIKSASAIDAVVMASAAMRGDVVHTSDIVDLGRLRRHFPSVRVISV